MNERLQNEIEAYENDTLDRKGLHNLLNYCYYYSYLQLLDDARMHILDSIDDDKLELGSRTWYSWFTRNSPSIEVSNLTCLNLSNREIVKGQKLHGETSQNIKFIVGDAHDMPFEDSTYGLVFGSSILHHLVLDTALMELIRILKPNGKIIFEEPLDINPFYKLYRRFTPGQRTKDEKAFTTTELNIIKNYFNINIYHYNLMSIPLGILAKLLFNSYENPLSRFANRLDYWLLKIPILKYLSAKVLIVGTPK